MRNTVLVMNRELYERRMVFVAALSLGLLGLASPLLPNLPTGSKSDSAQIAAAVTLIFAPVFTLAVAVLAGSAVLGRDLSEKRLSFYFLKPIPARAIWGGKMLAALVLSIGSGFLVLLPAMLLDSKGLMQSWITLALAQFLSFLLLGAVFGIAIGHQLGLVLRARSSWAALDVIALPLLGGMLATFVSHFFRARAFHVAALILLSVLIVFLISLYVSGAMGISRGRSEIKSVQRVSSIVLWSGVGIGVLLAILYTLWVRSASLGSLDQLAEVEPSRTGNTMAIGGISRGRFDYMPVFITNPETGQGFRIGGDLSAHGVVLSDDGQTAVWPRRLGVGTAQVQLVLGRADGSQIHETDVFYYDQNASSTALSPDGSLFALLDNNQTLSLWNLKTGSQVAALKLKLDDNSWSSAIRFLTNDRLRVFVRQNKKNDVAIFEYDLRSRSMVTPPRMPQGTTFWAMSVSPSGERILVRVPVKGSKLGRLELRDIRSGALIGAIDGVPHFWNSAFMSDGRVIVASIVQGRGILKIYSVDGVEEQAIDLRDAKGIRLGGEVAPGRFVVSTGAMGQEFKFVGSHQLSLVDVGSGGVKPLESSTLGLWPAILHSRIGPSQPPAPGSIATRLFYKNGTRELILFDPLTGERKVVAGKGRG